MLEIVNPSRFKIASKPLQEASASHGSSSESASELVYSNLTLEDIVKRLEDYVRIPIVISNPAYNHRKCDMIVEKGDITLLNKFLIAKYGWKLTKLRTPIEFVEISN